MIIGLDISLSNSGVVVINDYGKNILQVSIKTKKEDNRILRYHKFKVELFSWLQSNGLINNDNIFAIEDYIYFSKNSRSLVSLAEQGGIIRYEFYKEKLKLIEYSNSSVKKFLTGKGNCKKELIIKAVYKKYGFDTNDSNLADAFAIAQLGLAHHQVKNNWKPLSYFLVYEQSVLKEILK